MPNAGSTPSRWKGIEVLVSLTLVAVFIIALAVSSPPPNSGASAAPTTTLPATHSSTSSTHHVTTTTTLVTTTTAAPKAVVEVLNGNGIQGSASNVAAALTADGFSIKSTGDADSSDYHRNLIQYPTGALALAQSVQKDVVGDSVLQEDASLAANEILVTVGATNSP